MQCKVPKCATQYSVRSKSENQLAHHEQMHDLEYNTHMGVTKKCEICEARFSGQQRWGMHQGRSHGHRVYQTPYIYKCLGCPKCFQTPEALTNHRQECDVKTFDCTKCTQTFTTEYVYNEHCRNECLPSDAVVNQYVNDVWQPLQCESCFEVEPTQKEFKEHVESHRGKRQHYCDQCTVICNSQQSLDEHKEMAGNHYNKTCEDCHQVLSNRKESKKHEFEHGQTQHYQGECPHCKDGFTKDQFRIHAKFIHHVQVNRHTALNN